VTLRCRIRDAAIGDVEACVSLAVLAAPERSATDWCASLLRDIQTPERQLVVADRDGEIVAYGRSRLFAPDTDAPPNTAPRGYYLTGLFVRADQRRTGIGAALTHERLDWIAERAPIAWFFSNARNTASIELHRQFGFEEVTRKFFFPGLAFEGGEGILFCARLKTRP
jgi:ribosomal protein S18 acetylase RimI-like enzyme